MCDRCPATVARTRIVGVAVQLLVIGGSVLLPIGSDIERRSQDELRWSSSISQS